MEINISGDIKLENEDGSVIEGKNVSIQDIFGLINDNLSKDELKQTFCLQFIEQHGDTTFNQTQIIFLIKEFELLFSKCKTDEEKQMLRSIIEFISKINGEVHTYVKFYGD